MKLLIIQDYFHHKNKIGLNLILEYLNIEYKYSNRYLKGYNYMYSPAKNIIANIPTIYGPHFSIYPDNKVFRLRKGIYIQPSEWAKDAWKDNRIKIPIYSFPFPVEINKFKPEESLVKKDLVIVYYKRRDPKELEFLKEFCKNKNIEFKIFDYVNKYREEDYLKALQSSKYMIVLDAHESQGFAIQEALSCNIPLLVWNVEYMSQEYGSNLPKIKASSIPYWDKRCGEFFHKKEELEETFNKFINNLNSYTPRNYILENLSIEKCAERFKNLLKLVS